MPVMLRTSRLALPVLALLLVLAGSTLYAQQHQPPAGKMRREFPGCSAAALADFAAAARKDDLSSMARGLSLIRCPAPVGDKVAYWLGWLTRNEGGYRLPREQIGNLKVSAGSMGRSAILARAMQGDAADLEIRLRERDPAYVKSAYVYGVLARSLVLSGQVDKGLAAFREGLRLAPRDQEMHLEYQYALKWSRKGTGTPVPVESDAPVRPAPLAGGDAAVKPAPPSGAGGGTRTAGPEPAVPGKQPAARIPALPMVGEWSGWQLGKSYQATVFRFAWVGPLSLYLDGGRYVGHGADPFEVRSGALLAGTHLEGDRWSLDLAAGASATDQDATQGVYRANLALVLIQGEKNGVTLLEVTLAAARARLFTIRPVAARDQEALRDTVEFGLSLAGTASVGVAAAVDATQERHARLAAALFWPPLSARRWLQGRVDAAREERQQPSSYYESRRQTDAVTVSGRFRSPAGAWQESGLEAGRTFYRETGFDGRAGPVAPVNSFQLSLQNTPGERVSLGMHLQYRVGDETLKKRRALMNGARLVVMFGF